MRKIDPGVTSTTTKHQNRFYDIIKSFDSFGQPLAFNYKGDQTYKTLPGAMVSIIVYIIIGTYFVYRAKAMISDDDWDLMSINIATGQKEMD